MRVRVAASIVAATLSCACVALLGLDDRYGVDVSDSGGDAAQGAADALDASDANPSCPDVIFAPTDGPVVLVEGVDRPASIAVDPAPCGRGAIFWTTQLYFDG